MIKCRCTAFSPSPKPQQLSRVLAIAVHELVHTLGFASDAYQLYVDDKNRELGVDRVVQNITYPAASPNRTGRIIITPKVVQQVRGKGHLSEGEGGRRCAVR